jgi:hypothetical protein
VLQGSANTTASPLAANSTSSARRKRTRPSTSSVEQFPSRIQMTLTPRRDCRAREQVGQSLNETRKEVLVDQEAQPSRRFH